MRVVSQTYEELVSKGINRKLATVLADPESYDADLSIVIGKTNWDYFVPADATEVVPLWDSNADSVVRWKRAGIIEYVWLFHDDPKWIFLARSEQGIMAKLWQKWIEFQESADEPQRFAEAIGFRHWEKAMSLWSDDFEQFKQWTKSLTD